MPDRASTHMQAMLLTGHGGVDRLIASEVPIPTAGPGEVLVRLGGAAVNNTDINLRVGWYSKSVVEATETTAHGEADARDAGWAGNALHFPRIQGADGVGHIVAVGAGVRTERIGSRVIIDPILRLGSTIQYFGSDTPGSFAQYTCVPDANAVAIRSHWSDPELATFPCSSLAALHLISRAQVQAGQRVLITGASGGVGTAALQWAVARGAEVTAVADASKSTALETLGAAAVLPRHQRASQVFGESAFDAVIDVVGGTAFPDLLNVLRPHGQYATAGAIAGPVVELDLRTVYLKDLTLHGCTIPPVGLFADLVRAIEDGTLSPLVAATYRLSDLGEAQQAFLRKRHVGKIALSVD